MRGENLPEVSVIGLGYIGLPTAALIIAISMPEGIYLDARRS